MRAAVAAAGLLLVLQVGTTVACGYCVEDKIASTYDHAVVTRALGQKHHIAFFHIEGAVIPGERLRKALESSAELAAGVDKGSVRVSIDTLTISMAFDPERTSLARMLSALDGKLASGKLSLLPLRVIERPAELRVVGESR